MSKIIINLALKNKNFGIINICSGKGISLKNLVKKICKIENISVKINFINNNKKNSEPIKFWGCNKKLKLCLQNNKE